MKLLQVLENLLENHDWFYQYSDDHRVWTSGNESYKNIKAIREALKNEGIDDSELWKRYCPWG